MAVLPFLPGLAVEIIVNDAPLSEYDDDSDTPASPTTVTRYIESTSGANFAIKVSLTEEFPFPAGNMLAEISLDGEVVACKRIREAEFFEEHLFAGSSIQIGEHSKIQKFCFAELEIGKFALEDPSYKLICNVSSGADNSEVEGSISLPDLTSTGTITVGFTYIKNLRSTSPCHMLQSISASKPVSEKALKGQTHTHRAGYVIPHFVKVTLICIVCLSLLRIHVQRSGIMTVSRSLRSLLSTSNIVL